MEKDFLLALVAAACFWYFTDNKETGLCTTQFGSVFLCCLDLLGRFFHDFPCFSTLTRHQKESSWTVLVVYEVCSVELRGDRDREPRKQTIDRLEGGGRLGGDLRRSTWLKQKDSTFRWPRCAKNIPHGERTLWLFQWDARYTPVIWT